ncbi:MAG: hypothetical protein SCALA702_02110 [Melioribacteraceae bacterium]|nr:MAG: hypothetical protein SCALA702_02110 [Melioribacteraceae bacterium]
MLITSAHWAGQVPVDVVVMLLVADDLPVISLLIGGSLFCKC